MTNRMQIGLDGWDMLHFQCSMGSIHRNLLMEKHSDILQSRDWGIVMDLSMGEKVKKELYALTPEWPSHNEGSDKINYVGVESISLPRWDGEEAAALIEEQAEGSITLVGKNGAVAKFYLQPNEKLKALADMVLLVYPKVMA